MIRINAGASCRDVTPDFPVPLGGFGQRTTASEGVRDPVRVTALFLGGDSPAVVVTCDLIAIPGQVRSAVVEAMGNHEWFDERRLVLTATHSHSAPVPHDPSGAAGATARFTETLVAGIVEAVLDARATARDAEVVSGTGDVRIGFNRWRPDEESMVDTRIPVVSLIDISNREVFAVLFGAGCHPTTFGWDNMLVSADYPGVAKRCVEEAFPGAVAMFVNTTEGDVVPLTSARRDALDPRGYTGTDPGRGELIGRMLADEVTRVVRTSAGNPGEEDGSFRLVSGHVDVAPSNGGLDDAAASRRLRESTEVLGAHLGGDFADRIPLASLWAACSAAVIEADMDDEEMRGVMISCCYFLGLTARAARGSNPAPVAAPLQAMVIDQARFLFLPGEVLVGVGRLWSDLIGHPDSFTVGLANTHLRYLPLASHFAEPGADRRYETVTAGVAPGEVDRLVAHGAVMLRDGATA